MRFFKLTIAFLVALTLLAAGSLAQGEKQKEKQSAAVVAVQRLFSILDRGDVDAALKCFTFPFLALSVPDVADEQPQEMTFDTADALKPELARLAGKGLGIKNAKLVYQRGGVAAVTGTMTQNGQEIGAALFLLAKTPQKGWQIKIFFFPG